MYAALSGPCGPNVIWLQDILDAKFGKGDTRVICPITDAFVAHHGALGGFVRVWCRGKAPRAPTDSSRKQSSRRRATRARLKGKNPEDRRHARDSSSVNDRYQWSVSIDAGLVSKLH